MTTNRILEPSDTLRDAIRLAENIKIAFELVEEKSPKGNKKLTYLLQNLYQEIDALQKVLSGSINPSKGDSNCEEVDFEIVVDDDENVDDQQKVI